MVQTGEQSLYPPSPRESPENGKHGEITCFENFLQRRKEFAIEYAIFTDDCTIL